MAKRRRRRKQNSSHAGDTLKLLMAILLIAAAVFIVAFVYNQIRRAAGFSDDQPEETELQAESTSGADILIEEEAAPGLHENEDGSIYYLDDELEPVTDTWMEIDGDLYCFGEDGKALTGSFTEPGMNYRFDRDGRLLSIRYNPDYTPDAATVNKDYPSLVATKTLWAYLLTDRTYGSYYALMYKRTTEPTPHQLGGDTNPQFAPPYSMQIDGNYIYFLLSTDTPQSGEEETNGNLYRMRPGAEKRELCAEDVEGYKVLDGVVYYYTDGKIQRTTQFTEDDTINRPTDTSGVYEIDISTGSHAYLLDRYGNAVTGDGEALKAGNFTYTLSGDGEILSVREKTSVNKNGYDFSIEQGDLFGTQIARIVRQSADGTKEVISSEFAGHTGNLHYDFDSGYMFAEYQNEAGAGRILRISLDGDVDVLADADAEGSVLTLYGFQDGEVIVRAGSGSAAQFMTLRMNAVTPLAVATDPTVVSGAAENGNTAADGVIDITESTTDTGAPGTTDAGSTSGQSAGAGSSPQGSGGDTSAVYPQGPSATTSPAETGGAVETVGPGGDVLIGGAPS